MNFLAHPLTVALGWTLLHFLWQGLLVGLGTALVLWILRAAPAQTRHLAACLGLIVCLACPVVTLARFWPSPTNTLIQSLPAEPAPQPLSERPLAVAERPGDSLASALRPALPWIVGVWLTGCIALLLRLGSGWVWLTRLRHQHSSPATPEWQRKLDALARRMGLARRPQLRLCAAVAGPLAHGWWKPAILLPGSLLTGMAPDLLEALLAHELAHIQRQDYLANLLQCITETLLFYHPTVWWISAKIRSTREEACDDLAAKAIGEPRRLALALAELDLFQLPAPALGAHQGDLMTRIKRLLNPAPPRPFLGGLLPALLAAALLTPMMASTAPPSETNRPASILRPAELVAQLDALAAKEGIDPNLLRAMAEVESQFNPMAVSRLGSTGLLQVMPATARKYGAQDLQDPAQVMAAGARYLKSLLTRYNGDWTKAVAAYNGGEEALDAGKLSEETQRYVPTVLRLAQSKAVQAEPPARPVLPILEKNAAVGDTKAPRLVRLARHGGALTLDFDLTRQELAVILAENWNWLFTDGAEDQKVERTLPPMNPGTKGGLTVRMKGVSPKAFLHTLARQGFTPEPLSEAWLKQLPPAIATGEMKLLPGGEWDVRMQVVALDGYEVEFRAEDQAKPIARIVTGDKAGECPILRVLSLPRIRTEAISTKSMNIRVTERGTGRWGETTLDLSQGSASFRIAMNDTANQISPRAVLSGQPQPENGPQAKPETR